MGMDARCEYLPEGGSWLKGDPKFHRIAKLRVVRGKKSFLKPSIQP